MSEDLVWNILADDTDSRVSYSGSWNLTTGDTLYEDLGGGTLNDLSTNGIVFNNTVHETRVNGSSFTFAFSGFSRVIVYGTIVASPPSAVANGSVSCQLDDQQAVQSPYTLIPPNLSGNNDILCTSGSPFALTSSDHTGQPTSKEHKLTVTIDDLINSRVYVDYLVYELIPDPDTPLDGDVLQIGNNAGTGAIKSQNNIIYSSRWGTGGDSVGLNAGSTSTPGSSVTVKFNGTSIEMYGELSPHNSSNTATYQVDDNDPQQFGLFPPTVFTSNIWTQQSLVNVNSLPPGEHTLVVTHNGSATGMPLTVDYFLVTSLTTAEQQQQQQSPSPTPPPTSQSNSGRNRELGGIIGGIVGGVVLLTLVSFVIIWRMKRRRRSRESSAWEKEEFEPTPFVAVELRVNDVHDHPQRNENGNPANTTLRVGNLKLQQELSVLRDQLFSTDQLIQRHEFESGDSTREWGPGIQLQVHTDSGWRMGQDSGEHLNRHGTGKEEIPPNYTEV
ncbi:hypothetical protein D9758_011371 [Tetrapyrgos nigripes]|uniref:Uncharacterized protein n=1 Tax=Tetrapyrgos nigripes TaxID=182062 RepID=A0A8H5LK69_9AGAR|nr:hypothetical protein D9758_011371 [Tetrapyrgos nigripes]